MNFVRSLLDRLAPHAMGLLIAGGLPILLIVPIASGILDRFDYPVHRELAWSLTWPPHFLYHLILTAFRAVTGDWLLAQRLLLLVNYAALGLALYAFLARGVRAEVRHSKLSLMAVSLAFVYAIPALYPIDGQLYFGYVALSVYHNTTILLLKPIVAFHLLWLLLWLSPDTPYRARNGFHVIGALLVVLSAMAKPSYLVTLLPAVFLIVAWDKASWRGALLAVFLPGAAVLAWLFVNTFGGDGGGLSFAPLKVINHFTELWTVLPKIVLSLLFPLAMLATFRREVMADRLAILCWLMLLVGLSYGLLLAEKGERVFDGNWLWSGQISAFALFVVNARLLIGHGKFGGYGWRVTLAWLAFICHVIAGLVWYLLQYQSNPNSYW